MGLPDCHWQRMQEGRLHVELDLLADQDAGLLRTFLGELRLAREQALLRSLAADST